MATETKLDADEENGSALSLDAVQLNSLNAETDAAALTDEHGFALEELFRLALKFYKGSTTACDVRRFYNAEILFVTIEVIDVVYFLC